jgi:hypothetical protein
MILPNKKDQNQKNTVHKTQGEIEWFKHFEAPWAIHPNKSFILVERLAVARSPHKKNTSNYLVKQ